MPLGQLITVDDEVFEVVAEAPGRTSMLLVNRTKQCQLQVDDLERRLDALRAEIARVRADASQEQLANGSDNLDVHPAELRHP